VIAQGKRQSSQLSPIAQQQQNTENQRNMIRNSFVNNNQDESYRSAYKPRDSSLMLNPQEQHHHYYNDENDQKKRASSTQLPILNKLMSPTSEKHQKEKTGRFSIPFFNGKKDKKKDKEHIQQQQLSPTFNDKRMSNYQQHPDNMYHINQPQQQQQRQYHQPQPPRYQQMQLQPKQQQKEDIPELIAANRSSTQLANDQPQKSPTEQKEYVGYARAMWSFEATVSGIYLN
jgi:hypothetical protein